MKHDIATSEEIIELQESRKRITGDRNSKAPKNSGLTKEDVKKALMSMARSGYKIPAKLRPKAPF